MAFLAPDPIQSKQFIPGGAVPAAGGLLFCYQVGTTNKQNTYTDPTASTARTNPIVLDSGGDVPGNGEVWITSTAKFVLAPFNDQDPPQSPYWSRDNLPGVNDASQVLSEWVVSGLTPTFVNGSTFTLFGDQTQVFQPLRRVKTLNTAGLVYSTITSSVFAASTTIGIQSDSIGLDAGLTQVSYGLIPATSNSLPQGDYTIRSILVGVSTGAFFANNVSTGTLFASSNILALNYMGTNTSSNASSGAIGEYTASSRPVGNQVSLSSATVTSVASITLTAGDWDVNGITHLNYGATDSILFAMFGASTSNAFGVVDTFGEIVFPTAGQVQGNQATHRWSIPSQRLDISNTTIVNLLVNVTFTGSPSAHGMISARRRR